MRPEPSGDQEVDTVAAEFFQLDPNGSRTSEVIRSTFDQLYDGQHTGRYRWDQLYKTEKTHCGTLIEINLHREFHFEDGDTLDYQIGGIEVDCKYSQKLGAWMIPPEAVGKVCMVVWAVDNFDPKWSLGFVRAAPSILTVGSNRDGKFQLNASGKNAVVWVFRDAPLLPNILLQLDAQLVENIMRLKSGQSRLNALLRLAINRRVGRGVIATLAQQDDYMRRVRSNGGARTGLRAEGIIVLGQYRKHQLIARMLGVPEPGKGESIPVRVVPATSKGPGVAEIEGRLWRLARADDPVVDAPILPEVREKKEADAGPRRSE